MPDLHNKNALPPAKPASSLSSLYGRWNRFIMTKSAGLMGGIEISGIDPKTITDQQRAAFAGLMRATYRLLPAEAVVTQYYIHHEGLKLTLRRRHNPRAELLSRRRELYLNNARNLSGARLIHLVELPQRENLNTLASIDFITHLGNALTSQKSRRYVKQRLSVRQAMFAAATELGERVQALGDELQQVCDRFGIASADNRILSVQELWAFMRVMHSANPAYFADALHEPVPLQRWDLTLFDGDIEHLTIQGRDVLKIGGADPVYVRIASVSSYGDDHISTGFWINGPRPPVMHHGNYIIMCRWRPMSTWQRASMFWNRRVELERAEFSLINVLKGADQQSPLEEHLTRSDTMKQAYRELEEAQSIADNYGFYCSQVLLFDKDPLQLARACTSMNTAITQAGGQLVWESRGLMPAFESFLPGYSKSYKRDMVLNSSQFGACSHLYKSSEGVRSWGASDEEAQYVFESEDGVPFHFSPYIGGRMVVIGIGPIRSGKTFTKNTLAAHFLKFGGFYRAIDIDPGAEPIAEFFGNDGGIFRIEAGESRGFNPFASAQKEQDHGFKAHLLAQIGQMLLANDNPQMRTLEPFEQLELDAAIGKTLRLPRDMQSLSTMASHCSQGVRTKLSRWIEGGMFAHLFDNDTDAIGDFDKAVGAFNLAGVKDNPLALPIVMNEIFFRVVRLFEAPEFRGRPKFLDVDEAHQLFKIPHASQKLISGIRTWGKWTAGVGLWSQSPQEFNDIPDWPALRSAATTFFFMADPTADRALYGKTFLLSEGEIDAIVNLVPKRQALIVQREIGVSKVVNLHVEPEQYVINTSVGHEAETRRAMMREYGDPDVAIERTIEALGLRKPRAI